MRPRHEGEVRIDVLIFGPLRAIQGALGHSRGKPVILAITADDTRGRPTAE